MRTYAILFGVGLILGCKKDAPPPVAAEAPREREVEVFVEVERPAPLPAVKAAEDLDRVYFAFDSSALDGTYLSVLTEDAAVLLDHPEIEIEIQGHCDERGTTEYNLGLGERRAAKVKDSLVALGVAPDRISTISYGEEMPAEIGANESVYSRNRRVELRITHRGPGDENVTDTLGDSGAVTSID